MSTKFFTINSSSSGNCCYIQSGSAGILVDAGGSYKRIIEGLSQANIDPKNLTGVLITHEHKDHISALRVLTKNHRIKIIGNRATLFEIQKQIIDIDTDLFLEIREGQKAVTDFFKISPFKVSHDSVDAFGYRVETENATIITATDTGVVTESMLASLKNVDLALVEANYDKQMLTCGCYPPFLIRRILSDKGHLDNENTGDLVALLTTIGAKNVILGHLSNENNTPEKAYKTVKAVAQKRNVNVDIDIKMHIAPKLSNSSIIDI